MSMGIRRSFAEHSKVLLREKETLNINIKSYGVFFKEAC